MICLFYISALLFIFSHSCDVMMNDFIWLNVFFMYFCIFKCFYLVSSVNDSKLVCVLKIEASHIKEVEPLVLMLQSCVWISGCTIWATLLEAPGLRSKNVFRVKWTRMKWTWIIVWESFQWRWFVWMMNAGKDRRNNRRLFRSLEDSEEVPGQPGVKVKPDWSSRLRKVSVQI